jgi:hypothetical protein
MPKSNYLIFMLKKTPPKKTAPKAKQKKLYRTGEKCPESGLWSHFCKEKCEKSAIPLSKSETFPPCRTCGSVKWSLVMAAEHPT